MMLRFWLRIMILKPFRRHWEAQVSAEEQMLRFWPRIRMLRLIRRIRFPV